MTTERFQCAECKRFDHVRSVDGYFFCGAFTAGEGIPDAILYNYHDHRQPYFEGGIRVDNNLTFDPIEEVSHAL